MHLTRFTDLSLRVLIYLTHNERKGLVTVTELAERFKWSRNHMVKVVHFMSTKNWVQTHRGRFGGLTLKMHPSEYKGSSSKPPSLNDGGADLFKRVTFDQVLKSVESSRER